MTYDHTPIFIRSKTSPKRPKPKTPVLVSAVSDFSELTEAGRPPGSTDVYHCACVHVGRPLRSTGHVAVLSVGLGRPGRSTDVPQRSKIWPLTVDRLGRPPAVRNSDRLPTALFFWQNLLGTHPNKSLQPFYPVSHPLYIGGHFNLMGQ